jgi:hypothetical protein
MESMDEKRAEPSAEEKELAQQQSTADQIGAAAIFPFPSHHHISDSSSHHLAALRDKHSMYTAVAKACFQLNQYAMNGSSSSTLDDVYTGVPGVTMSSTLIHDPSMAAALSDSFRNLMQCIQTHTDRRAKIVCCQTLGNVGRATYARLRYSPQIFALRDSTHTRLEDEVGTDIPMALASAALEDPDDGVAASALQALGILCLSSGATNGTLVQDELWEEVANLSQQRPSPYAPTIADIEDEESYIPMVELQTRILENVLSPRLFQMVWRVAAFQQEEHRGMVLPVLTAALVHLSKTSVALYTMDREMYSKRWVEHDYVNLLHTFMNTLLIPSMQSSHKGHVAHTAATSAVRLVHVYPHASWVNDACNWAILVFKEELSLERSLENTMTNLSCLLICSRAIPFPTRTQLLLFCLNKIRNLPSTTMAPHGIHTAGLLVEAHGMRQYRRPVRVGFWAELALSFFLDGPIDASIDSRNPRSSSLKLFFESSDFVTAIKEVRDERIAQQREEMTLAFCMVAADVGLRHRDAPEVSARPTPSSSAYNVVGPQEQLMEWLRMSTMVLHSFSPCLGWDVITGFGVGETYMSQHVSLLVAAQASYTRLAQELNHAVGLLVPTSVTLRMVPAATPQHLLWDQTEESIELLSQYVSRPVPTQDIVESIAKVMDSYVQKELNGDGIINHHLRTYLLALAADQWVQANHTAARREYSGTGSEAYLNGKGALDLLLALSPRRIFSKVVENHRSQIETMGKKDREMYKKFAQDTLVVSVACVENIALLVSEWRKRHGATADVKNIYNAAIASLQGGDSNTPALPVCQGAIERIQAAFSRSDQISLENISFSPLLLNASDFERRSTVTASRSLKGQDAYCQGYLVMLCRLIISSRVDRAVYSMPCISSLHGAVRKQNWLRLALPPLPPSRNPAISISTLPKFAWESGAAAPLCGSDPAAMTLAYSMRRSMRYDGENEFRLMVTMQVHNLTAVEIPEGLRLSLTLLQQSPATSLDGQDSQSLEIREALNKDGINVVCGPHFSSATSLYKTELKSGDHLTLEVVAGVLPMTGALRLQSSVEFRGMDVESSYLTWIGIDGQDDDDTIGDIDKSQKSFREDGDFEGLQRKTNLTIEAQEMKLSPMIGLQPCPFVFFRDGSGDVDAFRFLWARLPFQIPPLAIGAESSGRSVDASFDTLRLTALSTLKFEGNPIPGGEIVKLWAFMSLTGKRILFVLGESDSGNRRGHRDQTIHVRGDDASMLCCVMGTDSARQAVVSALTPGMIPI